ncbi:13718_t:CDS:1, partial [Acaulospora colombiana]
ISVRNAFLESPRTCLLGALWGGPATSKCQTSSPSENLVAFASTRTMPEFDSDFISFSGRE